jgi:hypothetical protein
MRSGFFERYLDAFKQFMYLDVAAAHKKKRYLPANILAGDYDPHTAAGIVVEAYRRVYKDVGEGTTTNIILMTELASVVLAYNELPLLPYLEDFYTNPAFRTRLLSKVEDKRVADWLAQIGLTEHTKSLPTIVETTLRRIMLLSFPPVIGYALSQKDNLLDGRKLLRDSRSVCLSLNLEDDESMRYLCSLFSRQIELGIKERVPSEEDEEAEKPPPYFYMVDEVQNIFRYAGDSFNKLHTEARRAGVFVMSAHQDWGQIPLEMHPGFNQCGIIAVFRQNAASGRVSVERIGLPIDPEKSRTLGYTMQGPKLHLVSRDEQIDEYIDFIDGFNTGVMYLRLPGTEPFLAQTIPTNNELTSEEKRRLREIRDEYINLYFTPLAHIQQEIDKVRGYTTPSPTPSSNDTVEEAPTTLQQRLRKVTLRNTSDDSSTSSPPPPKEQPKKNTHARQDGDEEPTDQARTKRDSYSLEHLDLPEVDDDY